MGSTVLATQQQDRSFGAEIEPQTNVEPQQQATGARAEKAQAAGKTKSRPGRRKRERPERDSAAQRKRELPKSKTGRRPHRTRARPCAVRTRARTGDSIERDCVLAARTNDDEDRSR
jgi:hypothetical protein